MDKDNQFLTLIDKCEQAIKNNLNNNEYALYHQRYESMIKVLGDLRSAIKSKLLVQNLVYLRISQMIEQNDPEEIKKCVIDINDFYCKHYRKL